MVGKIRPRVFHGFLHAEGSQDFGKLPVKCGHSICSSMRCRSGDYPQVQTVKSGHDRISA
jgi:hypothetical protein